MKSFSRRFAGRKKGPDTFKRGIRPHYGVQAANPDQHTQLEALAQYLPLAGDIETFWLDPAQQGSATWTEHRDINTVMLATSLVPDGYLDLRQPEH
jgi:hypothetical protein